ncbi:MULTISPECIES: UTRA domain-containing protein [Streptomyces]|uniref:GntR family transcriptional regulator n=1 Tax=Streptomyces TaxID=1883 RepID=UPI0028896BAC|nr:UTRA domain-containing protein [Streptomyces sp. Ag109_G2-6]
MPYLTPRATGAPDAWTEEARAAGRHGGQRIVRAGETPASAEVAELLGVDEGATVVVRRRIIELGGQPCELTDTFYPAHIASGTPLAGTAKIRGGAVTLLASLGHVGTRVVETVSARMPSDEEREQLGLGREEPVLCINRVTYDAGDAALQADLMLMPATRQQLRYETRIG